MTKYLILVKHSLPEIVENIPAREWKLSTVGRERAQWLAERLLDYQPEVIISSVEQKAIETSEFIAKRTGVPVYVVEGLHEHDRSDVPFLVNDQFQDAVQEFFNKPTELVFGNETADKAFERFNRTVLSLLSSHKERTVAIVAHGTVISLFVSRLIGVNDFLFWNELGLPSFVVVDMETNTLVKKENIP